MKKPGLVVSYPPHMHCGATISSSMYTIILALCPALIYGIYLFGMDAARVISLSAVTCLVSEYGLQKLFKKKVSLTDGSALLTGLLLAAILPPGAPAWLVIVAGFSSMLVGKHVFGGLGSNPFNAALVGWAMVAISWKAQMNLSLVFADSSLVFPLGLLQKGGTAALAGVSLGDLFIGHEIGGIGSTSVMWLGLGGLILVYRGLIPWRVPVFFLIGVFITAWIFSMISPDLYAGGLFHLLTGGTMIGAFFLATDYSSTPVNKWGMVIFGLGCGLFAVMFRMWSMYPDGTMFAILIMNMLTPFLDRISSGRAKGAAAK